MNHDYSYLIFIQQRRQELMAEAANDRLVKLATAGRTPWWRRVAHALTPVSRHVLTPRHSTR